MLKKVKSPHTGGQAASGGKKIINDELEKLCDQMISDTKLKNGIRYCLGITANNSGAKRLRPLLCVAVASDIPRPTHLLRGDRMGSSEAKDVSAQVVIHQGKIPKSIIKVACSIEMLHCASLILDDLQDSCETRRGLMSAWKKFGVTEALMICHTMVALSFRIMNKNYLEDFSEVYFKMCLGQTLDLKIRFCSEKITANLYKEIVSNKTGILFSFAMKISARLNRYDNRIVNLLSELGFSFGFLYQANDDLKDEDWEIPEKDKEITRKEATTAKNNIKLLLTQYKKNFGHKTMLPKIINNYI